MFARAREAAGRRDDRFDAATLGELLALARDRYGSGFADVLGASRVWVNGDEPVVGDATALSDGDEVAVLPPVSGGGHDWGRDSLKSGPCPSGPVFHRGECNATYPAPGRS
jgi:molybdopterin converting factor small subunit